MVLFFLTAYYRFLAPYGARLSSSLIAAKIYTLLKVLPNSLYILYEYPKAEAYDENNI